MNKEHDMKKMISWITATIVALSFGLMSCANPVTSTGTTVRVPMISGISPVEAKRNIAITNNNGSSVDEMIAALSCPTGWTTLPAGTPLPSTITYSLFTTNAQPHSVVFTTTIVPDVTDVNGKVITPGYTDYSGIFDDNQGTVDLKVYSTYFTYTQEVVVNEEEASTNTIFQEEFAYTSMTGTFTSDNIGFDGTGYTWRYETTLPSMNSTSANAQWRYTSFIAKARNGFFGIEQFINGGLFTTNVPITIDMATAIGNVNVGDTSQFPVTTGTPTAMFYWTPSNGWVDGLSDYAMIWAQYP